MIGQWKSPARSDRRRFLGLAAAAAGSLFLPGVRPLRAAAKEPRSLSFFNTHTSEVGDAVYWAEGRFLPDGLAAIDYHLRDFRTDDIKPIDVRLLDLLHELNGMLGNRGPLHVISGYRSPQTNAMLAARSGKVARNSYHLHGMAIDVRLPDRPLGQLREAGLRLGRGGVGYYPDSQFVHLDTGPVRTW